MAILYITNASSDYTQEGTLGWCLDQASALDYIVLDTDIFRDVFNVLYMPASGITVNKSVTIMGAPNTYIIFVPDPEAGDISDRLLRITGTSAAPVYCQLSGCWFAPWESSNAQPGSILCNYAQATLSHCAFSRLSNQSTTTGVYCSNGTLNIKKSVIFCPSGNVVNYASSGTVNADNSTLIGGVKSGWSAGADCAVMTAAEAYENLINPDLFCFSPRPNSAMSTGRTSYLDFDLYQNHVQVGGAVGALGVPGEPDGLRAVYYGTYPDAFVKFYSGAEPNKLILDVNTQPVGFSTSTGFYPSFPYRRGLPILEETAGGLVASIIERPIDIDWYKACFSAIGIPVQTEADMYRIIPNFIELFGVE